MRGLKPRTNKERDQEINVAPYVGAWIETTIATAVKGAISVAPYVGAWIETFLAA